LANPSISALQQCCYEPDDIVKRHKRLSTNAKSIRNIAELNQHHIKLNSNHSTT